MLGDDKQVGFHTVGILFECFLDLGLPLTERSLSDPWEGLCFPVKREAILLHHQGYLASSWKWSTFQGGCWGCTPGPGAHSLILKVSTSAVVASKAALPCTSLKYVRFITFLPGLGGVKVLLFM